MNKTRRRKYALIWWIDSGETDVVPLLNIPKQHRQLHSEGTVVWKDHITKQSSKSKMKNQNQLTDLTNCASTSLTSFNVMPSSQLLYPPMQKNNHFTFARSSISHQLNIDEPAIYEFPFTVPATPVIEVINMQNFNQSTTSQNAETISSNMKECRINANNPSLVTPAHSNLSQPDSIQEAPEMISSFNKLIPEKITLGVVEFVEALAINLRHQYNKDVKENDNRSKETGFVRELSPGSGFYIDKNTILNIEEKCNQDWHKIVVETIDEVYGKEIKNFTAIGRNSQTRRGINKKLYKGLYNWVKKIDQSVTPDKFIKKINDIARNERKVKDKTKAKNIRTNKRQYRKIIANEDKTDKDDEDDEYEEDDEDDEDQEDNEDGKDDEDNADDEHDDKNEKEMDTLHENEEQRNLTSDSEASFQLIY
ncbi:altered inheritance of mitochondria protein 44-like [Cotesia glomerata]|uniref:altered inheritance of mitochondria protein 44-like n=1 Tax=Cotesia glomerata TaxID=32391 RepID=UPI001D016056|nr:altered inheritance of mitochondria protein 44-like [Cotesia glomerata]